MHNFYAKRVSQELRQIMLCRGIRLHYSEKVDKTNTVLAIHYIIQTAIVFIQRIDMTSSANIATNANAMAGVFATYIHQAVKLFLKKMGSCHLHLLYLR